jgi:flagellar basal-body rod protein FlgB
VSHPTDAVTVSLVRLALDAAQMRQQAIAHNIANANTPGFVPVRVDFEARLQGLRTALREGGSAAQGLLQGAAPAMVADTARPVALDLETAAMAENTVRYEALLKALGKQMAITATAIHQGKK